MDLLISEGAHLPDRARHELRHAQRDYIDTWVRLLQQPTSALAGHARVRIQAVLTVVNDIARAPTWPAERVPRTP